jgi:chromosome segregation ATPase
MSTEPKVSVTAYQNVSHEDLPVGVKPGQVVDYSDVLKTLQQALQPLLDQAVSGIKLKLEELDREFKEYKRKKEEEERKKARREEILKRILEARRRLADLRAAEEARRRRLEELRKKLEEERRKKEEEEEELKRKREERRKKLEEIKKKIEERRKLEATRAQGKAIVSTTADSAPQIQIPVQQPSVSTSTTELPPWMQEILKASKRTQAGFTG